MILIEDVVYQEKIYCDAINYFINKEVTAFKSQIIVMSLFVIVFILLLNLGIIKL
jgi:hypothetical protein